MDVRLPDGTIVKNVPEGMTQTALMARIQGSKPGMAEDVAKAVPSAAVRGVTNLAGMPADLWEMLSGGIASAAGQFMSPEGAAQLKDIAKPELSLPTSQRIRETIKPVTGELYQPQTRAGKIVGGTVEGASGGGVFGKAQAGLGALGGISAELAGAFSGDNPWAKAIAGFVGPMAYQARAGLRSVPGNMLRESMGDVDPIAFDKARQMMEQSRRLGIDLMAPEAMPPSSLQQLASDVIGSKEGGRVMNRFLANRPGQVKQAAGGLLDDVAPHQATPDVTMAAARKAATGAIKSKEQFRSASVKPYYDAAKNDPIPAQEIDNLIQNLEAGRKFAGAANQGAIDDIIAQLRGTEQNAAAMDDTFRSFRTSADAPAINATTEQRRAASLYGGARDQLDDTLRTNSKNIREGRDTYRQITEDIIEPLTAGPVGRVAGKQGFDPANPESLNPISAIGNEKLARPESIRELYTHLNKQDPKAFPGMARTYLENTFDQAAQRVQAGENRMVGANFAKAVIGTPQQEANFLETMRGVARASGKNPDEVARGAKNLMEILQATGKVPGAGSPTGGRIASNEMASRNSWAAGMEMVSTAPAAPIAKRIREWSMGANYKRIAEVLTAPDSIDQLIKIGKYKPTTTTSMAFAAGLLEGTSESGR